jgi:hypothetical protein
MNPKKPVTRYSVSPRRKSGQRGNVLMEFCLSATLLLLLGSGVTDFARLFSYADTAAAAAEAGVQYGALSPAHWGDYVGIQNAALADDAGISGTTATASQYCTCSVGGASIPCPADCSGGGNPEMYLKVAVTVPFSPLFQFPWTPVVSSVTSNAMTRVQ